MNTSNSNKSKNNNPDPSKQNDSRYERVVVGYRLVAMQASQVDEIAQAEGRGHHASVVDARPRCPWCFLKGGAEGKHFCRWRTSSGVRPKGGNMRQVPIYEWHLKK